MVEFLAENFADSFDTSGRYKYTAMFFNSWEFKTNNLKDSCSLRLATANMITTEFKDEKVKEKLDKRTQAEWAALYTKRAILITVNVFFLLGCAYAIFMATISKPQIIQWFKDTCK